MPLDRCHGQPGGDGAETVADHGKQVTKLGVASACSLLAVPTPICPIDKIIVAPNPVYQE